MIDLHVHTKISDSSLTALETLKMAKVKGITHVAITDHDTTMGLKEAVNLGKELGVHVIPGIEISAYDYRRNKRTHILGLCIEPGHPALESLCKPLVDARCQASYEMVRRIIEAGYNIQWETVEKFAEGGTGVYKQHIMHALLEKGYCHSIYGDLYKKLFRRGDRPDTQGIAFLPIEYIDAKKAIKAVREAGGIAVLAHPGQLDNYDAIEEWVQLGLEGIEAFHDSHSEEEIENAWEYAERFNLIVTGGSDFHGFYGERPTELGCKELDIESVDALLERKKRSP
ncbi:MAG: PHP domain-containing protein [Clostridia bacterium]|nr:PHP domain-containing protein [Clostridia bacterium]